MKNLMRLIAVAGLCTLLYQFVGVPSLHAQAQGNTTNAQKLEKLEALSKQLKLTPEQKNLARRLVSEGKAVRELAGAFKVHAATIYCLVQQG